MKFTPNPPSTQPPRQHTTHKSNPQRKRNQWIVFRNQIDGEGHFLLPFRIVVIRIHTQIEGISNKELKETHISWISPNVIQSPTSSRWTAYWTERIRAGCSWRCVASTKGINVRDRTPNASSLIRRLMWRCRMVESQRVTTALRWVSALFCWSFNLSVDVSWSVFPCSRKVTRRKCRDFYQLSPTQFGLSRHIHTHFQYAVGGMIHALLWHRMIFPQ